MDHLERTASNSRQSVSLCFIPLDLVTFLAVSLKHLPKLLCGKHVMCVSLAPQQALYPAQVCGIVNESETVKRLRIAVHSDFSFKAGQW